jgi:hypothetical protein
MTRPRRWSRLLLLLCVSCSRDLAPIPETQYPAGIIGDWQGTVADMKETISFRADGGFSSQVRQLGFLSNTLGQGVTGTIRGTWALQGRALTLTINGADNERLLNTTTTSILEAVKRGELVARSATGEASTFVRVQ